MTAERSGLDQAACRGGRRPGPGHADDAWKDVVRVRSDVAPPVADVALDDDDVVAVVESFLALLHAVARHRNAPAAAMIRNLIRQPLVCAVLE